MKCSRCGRSITHAAGEVRMRDEVLLFGPKCAKAAGITPAPKPAGLFSRIRQKPDDGQLPLI